MRKYRLAFYEEIANLEAKGFLLTEEEAESLKIGDLFTARNGQWYIVVES